MQYLIEFKRTMDAIDPAAFHIALAVLAMALVFMFRKAAPAWWAKLPPRLQPLPAMLFAALLAAPTGADAWAAAVETVRAVLVSGFGAIGLFRFVKETTGTAPPAAAATRTEGETIVPPAGADE